MTIGSYRHVGTLSNPGHVPDGEGGYTETWTPTPPDWPISIEPATARDMERIATGTIIGSATHVITGRWRGDVTLQSRLTFNGREFHITSVRNVDERNITLQLVAEEQLD